MLTFQRLFWGSSTSGPQTEGACLVTAGWQPNLWDYWYKVEPNRYNEMFRTNIYFMNIGSKILIFWPRQVIQPFELLSSGTGFPTRPKAEINPQRVAFYRRVFEATLRLESALINLYHFGLPFALQEDRGGWKMSQPSILYIVSFWDLWGLGRSMDYL